MADGWIRDLTREGIEPNPGPDRITYSLCFLTPCNRQGHYHKRKPIEGAKRRMKESNRKGPRPEKMYNLCPNALVTEECPNDHWHALIDKTKPEVVLPTRIPQREAVGQHRADVPAREVHTERELEELADLMISHIPEDTTLPDRHMSRSSSTTSLAVSDTSDEDAASSIDDPTFFEEIPSIEEDDSEVIAAQPATVEPLLVMEIDRVQAISTTEEVAHTVEDNHPAPPADVIATPSVNSGDIKYEDYCLTSNAASKPRFALKDVAPDGLTFVHCTTHHRPVEVKGTQRFKMSKILDLITTKRYREYHVRDDTIVNPETFYTVNESYEVRLGTILMYKNVDPQQVIHVLKSLGYTVTKAGVACVELYNYFGTVYDLNGAKVKNNPSLRPRIQKAASGFKSYSVLKDRFPQVLLDTYCLYINSMAIEQQTIDSVIGDNNELDFGAGPPRRTVVPGRGPTN